MKVCITGSDGFIGSHIVERLGRYDGVDVEPLNRKTFSDGAALRLALKDCTAVVHLAAMNRGEDDQIYETNVSLVKILIEAMRDAGVGPHVVFSSSTQASQDNPYGRSKKDGTDMLRAWAEETGAPLSVFVIPNVFGDGCKPFYNSVVATFCHQLTHGETPKIINDSSMELIYINDLAEHVCTHLFETQKDLSEIVVKGTASIYVSELLALLESFRESYFVKRTVPDISDTFHANLYRVFVTYVDYDDLMYQPEVHSDDRGDLLEIVRNLSGGQVFVSSTRPGVTRGNHYHTRKFEKFCILKGSAVIRLRKIGTDRVVEYVVDGRPAIVEIPIFRTHNIENTGGEDLLTLFWVNEIFDPGDSDTYFEEV